MISKPNQRTEKRRKQNIGRKPDYKGNEAELCEMKVEESLRLVKAGRPFQKRTAAKPDWRSL